MPRVQQSYSHGRIASMCAAAHIYNQKAAHGCNERALAVLLCGDVHQCSLHARGVHKANSW